MRKKITIPIILVLCIFMTIVFESCLFGKCIKETCSDGEGTYQYNNGDVYVGEWKNYKLNGKGIFYFNSGQWEGSRHEGEWKDNKMYGQVSFILPMATDMKVSGKTTKPKDTEPSPMPMVTDTKVNGRIINITGGAPLRIHRGKLL